GVDQQQWSDYSGLRIALSRDPDGKLGVVSYEVTSSSWTVEPGISIGQNKDSIVLKLGPTPQIENHDGFEVLYYSTKQEDIGELYFKSGVLSKIHLYVNPC